MEIEINKIALEKLPAYTFRHRRGVRPLRRLTRAADGPNVVRISGRPLELRGPDLSIDRKSLHRGRKWVSPFHLYSRWLL
jgi:hypothetical protein